MVRVCEELQILLLSSIGLIRSLLPLGTTCSEVDVSGIGLPPVPLIACQRKQQD